MQEKCFFAELPAYCVAGLSCNYAKIGDCPYLIYAKIGDCPYLIFIDKGQGSLITDVFGTMPRRWQGKVIKQLTDVSEKKILDVLLSRPNERI